MGVFISRTTRIVGSPFVRLLGGNHNTGLHLFITARAFTSFTTQLNDGSGTLRILKGVGGAFTLHVISNRARRCVTSGLPGAQLGCIVQARNRGSSNGRPVVRKNGRNRHLVRRRTSLFPTRLLKVLPGLRCVTGVSNKAVMGNHLPVLARWRRDCI